MSATLFWKVSNQDHVNQRLKRNLDHILKFKPELAKLFEGTKDKVEHFLNLFFPSLETIGYVANLSLEDKSFQKINLSLRIPAHPEFSDYLDVHSSFAVIGYWNMTTNSPWFTPEKIMITHNDDEPTEYEHEIECSYQRLDGDKFPDRNIPNVLNRQLANDLPKISVLTSERLENWNSFLQFKRRLIRQKTVGLRYIAYDYDHKNSQLRLLVTAQDAAYLEKARRGFLRQNLQLFDLNISENDWTFALPELDNDKKTPKSSLELGQITRGKKVLEFISFTNLSSNQRQIMQEAEFPFQQAAYAWLRVDISEDWKNKLDSIDTESNDEETLFNNQEVLNGFIKNIPDQGFISFSLVGDWALIKRQERSIRNLKQNENCYSPYLSSYLFDITQAKEPLHINEVDYWYNEQLNEAQQSAVKKMLSAPDLCLIQGPPGTGKTTVIAEAILQFAKEGQTVLLASQAHDAIDNALSRIKNKPELRAIRLAKESRGRSKITDDGKQFAGEQALARHYDALAEDLDLRFLKPLRDKKSIIDKLKLWVDQAEFLSLDIQNAEKKLLSIKEDGIQHAELLKFEQQKFDEESQQYDETLRLKQELVQLRDFLSQKGPAPLSAQLPQETHALAEILFSMIEAKVNIPFSWNDFKFNPASQMLILNALFDIWFQIEGNLEQIDNDIQRLDQAGVGGLISIETQLKIQSLNQEISLLADQMEIDDSDEIVGIWRRKRRELSELKQCSDGLTHPCYKLFIDAERFTRVNDANELSQSLIIRIEVFKRIKKELGETLERVLIGLNKRIDRLTSSEPNDKTLRQMKSQVEALREQYQLQLNLCRTLKDKQLESLQLQNFNQEFDFQSAIDATKQHIKNLEDECNILTDRNSDWLPLFEQWQAILKEKDQASQDWELLQEIYPANCNLVAISCNEREQTLTDAGLDGFDVVIIDEVSKATPLELLLPLMRARKAILVGDHRQLPPLFQESQDASNTFEDMVNEEIEEGATDTLLTKENFKRYEKMVTASLFKELFEKAPESLRERLTVQFRMHPQIMKMINYFYEGQLVCGNPDKDRQHFVTLKSKYNDLVTSDNHLLWIDTSYDEKGMACLDEERSTNPTEAKLIAHALVNINEQMKKAGFNAKDSKGKQKVGVVSFYQAQCRVIREAIKSVNHGSLKFDAIDVEINTVIRYQGKEKPIILISLVRNDGKEKTYRRSSNANVARFEFINVAMSRAQNLLMVFGARNMLEMRDVILPNMDTEGSSKKKIYQDIFNRLDREARVCSVKEFMQACTN
ncbi:DEAD/DEAH box helicase [Acinetobacter towneri]|uniref:DEAD/DEAH box helicase n=1 Tax=Acinetobacter towneri TaxID=202956 RepID=UPI001F163634|nr:AAA domain-containing protein [Acinetobacter towneri]UIP24173.1 AAA domain-containing protein [Acinetobacter towneri]